MSWMGERIKLFKYNKYDSIYLIDLEWGKILHTYAYCYVNYVNLIVLDF